MFQGRLGAGEDREAGGRPPMGGHQPHPLGKTEPMPSHTCELAQQGARPLVPGRIVLQQPLHLMHEWVQWSTVCNQSKQVWG